MGSPIYVGLSFSHRYTFTHNICIIDNQNQHKHIETKEYLQCSKSATKKLPLYLEKKIRKESIRTIFEQFAFDTFLANHA